MVAPIQTVSAAATQVTINPAAGSTLVLTGGGVAGGTITSVTDSKGQTWTLKNNSSAAGGAGTGAYLLAAASGSTTITVNFSAPGTLVGSVVIVREYSSVDALSFDLATGQSASGTNPTSGATGTTNQALETIVGWVVELTLTLPTAGTGYGNLTAKAGATSVCAALEDKSVGSTGAQTATFVDTFNGQYFCGVMTFKTNLTSNGIPDSLLLLGAGT